MRRIDDVPRIPRLPRTAHKGDRGHVMIVAGSLRMSGAARLAGWGALRGGAGLVTLATPDVVQPIVASELPCALTLPLASRKGVVVSTAAGAVREQLEGVAALAVGPGLTTGAAGFLRRLLDGLGLPVLLDADALTVLATEPALLETTTGPRILTPHPGEAGRLLGRAVGPERDVRVKAAGELAERYRSIVVLKGAHTVVCDGERFYINQTGNPGMATGGTGDILTGLLASRLAAGADPFSAALQAVRAHGRAGDLAAAAVGENAMIATDLLANLAAAIAELTQAGATAAGRGTGSRRYGPRGR